MTVTILLSSTLRGYVPRYNPASGVDMEVKKGTTVADLCFSLDVPVEKVKIVMVEGRQSEMSRNLNGDERVALFPPVGGG